MPQDCIPLNKHDLDANAVRALRDLVLSPRTICGGCEETERCHAWLKKQTGTLQALLTSSCTDALEMATLLVRLKPGDEVIMPSFTFSSTATAVVLRGAVPVFVDIRPDTLNIDETLIEQAITKKTRAICVVHYAGVACEMDAIIKLAKKHRLIVIEDAAQGVGATYKGRALGTLGDLGAYSFHDSKVVTSGEGGALLINRKAYTNRAEILWEKGTNRSRLLRGEIAKYTWVDVGSSFLMSDLSASLLYTQLKISKRLINERLKRWEVYHRAFEPLEKDMLLTRPTVPAECKHNGHIYYILLKDKKTRDGLRAYLSKRGIEAAFHYIPLHSAPAGKKYGRAALPMTVTNRVSNTLLRLPLYTNLTPQDQSRIIQGVTTFLTKGR